eukprot:jgi/Mesen1/6834/ME000351S05950
MPLRKKYKILKKVKDHHKKKAKEAKKNENKKGKVEKDPGIPNAWPFKEQELAALEARRQRALEEVEKKKQEKKERVAEKWLKYLREELPTVAFKCSTQAQKAHLGQRAMPASLAASSDALKSSESLGAETLLQLLKNYARNLNIKTAITVGVVGFPNVGKSSLINSLKRTRVASVGSTPGVTKAMQEVHLDKHVKLLDCPGIVFASTAGNEASAALRNAIKVERLDDPIAPVAEILKLCSAERLMGIYKIERFSGVDEFVRLIAMARGKLKKGGIPNTAAAAKSVLKDWNEGDPSLNAEHDAAAIVTDYSKEFDVDEVFRGEETAVIAGLPSMADGDYTMMQAGETPTLDTEGLEKFLRQNDTLYDADGIHNPHAARAEKKKKRKKSAVALAGAVGTGVGVRGNSKDDDEEYDFAMDYDGEGGNAADAADADDEEEDAEGDSIDAE